MRKPPNPSLRSLVLFLPFILDPMYVTLLPPNQCQLEFSRIELLLTRVKEPLQIETITIVVTGLQTCRDRVPEWKKANGQARYQASS